MGICTCWVLQDKLLFLHQAKLYRPEKQRTAIRAAVRLHIETRGVDFWLKDPLKSTLRKLWEKEIMKMVDFFETDYVCFRT